MKAKSKTGRKRTMTAVGDMSKAHVKMSHRPTGGARNAFVAEVDAFIEKYRAALKRLARK